ncbi:cell adhesion molecule 1-like [Erpetoichthys calabaricus]|uniref:cell adhesion molecule 1-like n=1 Tax=Erpetoichthys calabaricus TaxID=27687 RepID=UPI002234659B|nr:cell adhesion molecule 1-like [Erpetoichthys calabaricus]
MSLAPGTQFRPARCSFSVITKMMLSLFFSKCTTDAVDIPVIQPTHVYVELGTAAVLLCYFNCSCPGKAYGSFQASKRKEYANITCISVGQIRTCESKSIIVNTTLDDENVYRCQVKIPGENISFEGEGSGTKLIIYAEPSSLEIREAKPLVEGTPSNLTCLVRGKHLPNITFDWFRTEPRELTSIPIFTSLSEMQSVYSFTPSINDHRTAYWCQASHPLFKRSIMQKKLLDVKYGPQTLNVTSLQRFGNLNNSWKSLEIPKHSHTVLLCSANGNPEPSVMWFHEKEGYINSTKSHVGSDGHILVIEHMTKENEGFYRCVANNSYGTINVTIYIRAVEGTDKLFIFQRI